MLANLALMAAMPAAAEQKGGQVQVGVPASAEDNEWRKLCTKNNSRRVEGVTVSIQPASGSSCYTAARECMRARSQ